MFFLPICTARRRLATLSPVFADHYYYYYIGLFLPSREEVVAD